MKQKKVREEGEHETTINVTIAKASILKPGLLSLYVP